MICGTLFLYSKERLVYYNWFKTTEKLNQVTIKDKTLLPLIGEVIDKLKEAKYFNKPDLI